MVRDSVHLPRLEAGRQLGKRYVVLDHIGSGFEGEVYRVREVGTRIERAAKVFYPKRNPNGRALQRYAQKLHKLKRVPSIIQYHHRDTFELYGRRFEFLISEFVEGQLLSAFQAEQPGKRFLSFEALHLLRALAESVAPIHAAGEYHGDLHPDNIIVQRKGIGFDVKLLDFFDLGRSTKERMAEDVVDLVTILYGLVGGSAHYSRTNAGVKGIVLGRKRTVIARRFRNAAGLLKAIDELAYE